MFLHGTTKLNLDERGRLGVPTRYRDELRVQAENKLWVTIGPEPEEKRLLIYPDPEWKEVQGDLRRQDGSQHKVRHAQRRMIGAAAEVVLDSNGRVLIPQLLREYAGLDKKVVLVGMLRKFELWAEPLWEEAMVKGDEEHAGADVGFNY